MIEIPFLVNFLRYCPFERNLKWPCRQRRKLGRYSSASRIVKWGANVCWAPYLLLYLSWEQGLAIMIIWFWTTGKGKSRSATPSFAGQNIYIPSIRANCNCPDTVYTTKSSTAKLQTLSRSSNDPTSSGQGLSTFGHCSWRLPLPLWDSGGAKIHGGLLFTTEVF